MPPPFRFLRANRLPECPAWLDCTFDDCYALNYAHSGSLWWGMNNQTLQKLTGPIVWWTWPGPRFTYGCKNTPPWDHFYVTFAGPWADELVRMRGFSSIFEQPVCAIGNPEPIFSKMTQLIQALDHRDEPLAWTFSGCQGHP